jgi:chitinase
MRADFSQDEYPPAAFWQGNRAKQYIRFSPGAQNEGAGSLFKLGFCGYGQDNRLPSSRSDLRANGQRVYGNIVRSVTDYREVVTQRRVEIDFPGLVNPGDWGLEQNLCWPEHLLYDPGFAVLTDDRYYGGNAQLRAAQGYAKDNYPGKIPQDILDEAARSGYKSMDGYRKRDDKHALDPAGWVLNDGNSTRSLTKEELEELGIIKCDTPECQAEMKALGIESAQVVQPSQAPMVQATATAITTPLGGSDRAMATASAGSGIERLLPQQPRATAV